MTPKLQFARTICLGVCLCAAPNLSPVARSQAASGTAQEARSPGQAPQTEAAPVLGFGDDPEERRTACRSFLMGIAGEEPRAQNESQLGTQAQPVRVNYVKILGFSEDQERRMRTICVDSWEKISGPTNRNLSDYFEANQRRANRDEIARLRKLNDEAEEQAKTTLDETIAKLSRALGDGDFKKLDNFVYLHSYRGIAADLEARKRKAAERQNPSSNAVATASYTIQ